MKGIWDWEGCEGVGADIWREWRGEDMEGNEESAISVDEEKRDRWDTGGGCRGRSGRGSA